MSAAKRHGGKTRSFATHQQATGTSPDGVRVYPCDEGGARHFHFGHHGKKSRVGKSATRMKRW
jgi:adenosylcobinamide amidohydrolase